MFRLALIQMLVEGGEKARNLERAAQRVVEAARNGAAVAVLPEVMDLGWTHPSARSEAGAIPDGETFQSLRALAREHGLYVCSGLAEKTDSACFNAAVLLAPDGKLLLHHRKLNELEIAHDLYAQGDRLGVCHTDLGTIGLMICADAFAQDRVLSRTLGYMGADIILSPSSWAVPGDHDNSKEPYGELWRSVYSAVATEFSLWIAGVSNVGRITAGPWQGWNCIGCAQAVAPTGETVLMGPYGVDADTILYLDVETVPRPARGCGWGAHWRQPS
ncbi:MAG TPA: carbon-nitrogen hydrolase family protein [Chthonomonadaceae bacterium]|nr:carbon-nitrogen hydrolase family protein [Chthonomonadaceae bacterium]